MPAPFLSVREIAHILAVSIATVYRLAADGELPHIRVGNALRIRPHDLRAFIARERRPG